MDLTAPLQMDSCLSAPVASIPAEDETTSEARACSEQTRKGQGWALFAERQSMPFSSAELRSWLNRERPLSTVGEVPFFARPGSIRACPTPVRIENLETDRSEAKHVAARSREGSTLRRV